MMRSLARRLCFESALAAVILENPSFFLDVINEISFKIVKLLTHPQNQAFLAINQIINDDVILQLYSNTHFGTFGKSIDFCPSQTKFIETAIFVLLTEEHNLPKILHFHQIFMQSIFDKLPFKSSNPEWALLKEKLVDAIFKNELFNKARIKVNEMAGDLTTQVGIAGNIFCSEQSATELHQNILGMFTPNLESFWGNIISRANLPSIAGPSGHTGSSILLASIVGELKPNQLRTYLTAIMGTLVGGGYHSADEVMIVANRTGIFYQPGEYHLLPQEFLCSTPATNLAKKYPEFLLQTQCPKTGTFPPTLFVAGAHGLIRATSNRLYDSSRKKGISETKAQALQKCVYYGGFFGVKLLEHHTSETESFLNSLYKAAIDTSNLIFIEVVVNKAIAYLGTFSRKAAYGLKKSENLLSFGLFSYHSGAALSSAIADSLTSSALEKFAGLGM